MKSLKNPRLTALIIALVVLLASVLAQAGDERPIISADLGALTWRPLGPANMGGRVAAVALVPGSRTDFYVGFATGGLFKTTNLGTTFQEVFGHQATSSIGALGVANVPEDWSGWDDLAAAGDSVPVADREKLGAGRLGSAGTIQGPH